MIKIQTFLALVLSGSGSTIPYMNLANYVCTVFSILAFTVTIILKSSLADPSEVDRTSFISHFKFASLIYLQETQRKETTIFQSCSYKHLL